MIMNNNINTDESAKKPAKRKITTVFLGDAKKQHLDNAANNGTVDRSALFGSAQPSTSSCSGPILSNGFHLPEKVLPELRAPLLSADESISMGTKKVEILMESESVLSLSAPVMPKTANILLEDSESQPGCSTNIRSVQIHNTERNGTYSAKISAIDNSNRFVWTTHVLTHLSSCAANKHWTVICSHYGELSVYSTACGSLAMSLTLEDPAALMCLAESVCGMIDIQANVRVWDLKIKRCLLIQKLSSLIRKKGSKVTHFSIAATGAPIVACSSGDIWFYSFQLNSWRQLETGTDSLSSIRLSLEYVAKALPNGLISRITLNPKNIKSTSIANSLSAENAEEEQLALLLQALEELQFFDEYRLIFSLYVQRLISRVRIPRLKTLISSLDYADSQASGVGIENLKAEIETLLDENPHVRQRLRSPSGSSTKSSPIDLGFL